MDAWKHTATLNNGKKMPLLSFGCWELCGNDCTKAVETAIKAGMRSIDTAMVYGNEVEVGRALKKMMNEGVVKREDLFVTSKLWCTMWGDVETACKQTLADLQLDYLDLYLVHIPVAMERTHADNHPTGDSLSPKKEDGTLKRGTTPAHVMWKEMEALVHKGLIKSVGVANWPTVMLADLLNYCTIKPAVNQVEINAYFANMRLAKFTQQQGIHVCAYSPMGHGQSPSPPEDAVIVAIGKKHGKSPAQVLLRWLMQRGVGAIFKSQDEKHIKENGDLWKCELSNEEMCTIATLDRQTRSVPLDCHHSIPLYD